MATRNHSRRVHAPFGEHPGIGYAGEYWRPARAGAGQHGNGWGDEGREDMNEIGSRPAIRLGSPRHVAHDGIRRRVRAGAPRDPDAGPAKRRAGSSGMPPMRSRTCPIGSSTPGRGWRRRCRARSSRPGNRWRLTCPAPGSGGEAVRGVQAIREDPRPGLARQAGFFCSGRRPSGLERLTQPGVVGSLGGRGSVGEPALDPSVQEPARRGRPSVGMTTEGSGLRLGARRAPYRTRPGISSTVRVVRRGSARSRSSVQQKRLPPPGTLVRSRGGGSRLNRKSGSSRAGSPHVRSGRGHGHGRVTEGPLVCRRPVLELVPERVGRLGDLEATDLVADDLLGPLELVERDLAVVVGVEDAEGRMRGLGRAPCRTRPC